MSKTRKLSVVIGADVSQAEKAFNQIGKRVERTGKKIQEVGLAISKTFGVVGVAVGGYAAKMAYDVDDALDKIRAGTGAVGKDLETLQADFRAVARSVPQNFDTVATVIADVNTRLGMAGEDLRGFSKAILDSSRLLGSDFSSTLNASARAIQGWGVSAADSVIFMDKLFVASQSTGIAMDRLAERVARDGSTFRQLGFDVEEVMALLGTFEKQGLDVEKSMMSFKMAVSNLSRAGIQDLGGAMRAVIADIKNVGSATKANEMAIKVFGSRSGPELAAAIREGRFEVQALADDIKNAGGAIEKTTEDTNGFAEQWDKLKNSIGLAFEPLGAKILAVAEEAIAPLLTRLERLAVELTDTEIKIGLVVVALGAGATALGTMTIAVGALCKALAPLAGLLAGAASMLPFATVAPGALAGAGGLGVLPVAATAGAAVLGGVKTGEQIAKWRDPGGLEENKKQLAAQAQLLKAGGLSPLPFLGELPQIGKAPAPTAPAAATVMPAATEGIWDKLNKTKKTAAKGRSGPSATETLVSDIRDQIKYMSADGEDFLPILAEWEARLKPLSDDWKTLKDLQMQLTSDAIEGEKRRSAAAKERHEKGLRYAEEARRQYWDEQSWMTSQGLMGADEYLSKLKGEFANLGGADALAGVTEWTEPLKETFGKLQAIVGDNVSKTIKSLNSQFENGRISAVEYESALAGLIGEYENLPLVIKLATEEMERFQQQQGLAKVSTQKLVEAAQTDMTKGLAMVPDKIGDAFTSAITKGESLGGVFQSLLQDIAALIIKASMMRALFGASGKTGLLGGLFKGMFASGGVFVGGRVVPFAKGGVVTEPTLFPMANGAGLMGEAGPEAVMPLTRIGGKLGVRSEGGSAPSVSINVENKTGAQIESGGIATNYNEQSKQLILNVVLENVKQGGALAKGIKAMR